MHTTSPTPLFFAFLLAASLMFCVVGCSSQTASLCTVHPSALPDLLPFGPPVSLNIETAISHLIRWEAHAVSANVSSIVVDLTVSLSPGPAASRSTVLRYCSHIAAPLVAHCASLQLDCLTGDAAWHHASADTVFARFSSGEVEVFHMCRSPHASHARLLRVTYQWDPISAQLTERQRSVVGNIPGTCGPAGTPLTAWLQADGSAVLASLAVGHPTVAELPHSFANGELTLYSAFSLQMADLVAQPQWVTGCWEPQLRVGALIVGDAGNITGLSLFSLPLTHFQEPLELLAGSQISPRPTDPRRCVRNLDNSPLRRCHISASAPSNTHSRREALVVVEAESHQECQQHPREGMKPVYFRSVVSLSAPNHWSVTPFTESSGDDKNGAEAKIVLKGPMCPTEQRTLSDAIGLCSEGCANRIRQWWTSPGALERWSCRTTHLTMMELGSRAVVSLAIVIVLALVLNPMLF